MATQYLDTNFFDFNPGYEIYVKNTFYVLTLPKIGSSYCRKHFTYVGNAEIEFHTLKIKSIRNENFDEDNQPDIQKEVLADWKATQMGLPSKRKFIFLTRTPVDKWISGFIQDILLSKLNREEFIGNPFLKSSLENMFGKTRTEEFMEYMINESQNAEFDGIETLPLYFLNIYRKCVSTLIDSYISDPRRLIPEVNTSHKQLYNTFLAKIILYLPKKYKKENIMVWDIDRINISTAFNLLFGTRLPLDKVHTRGMIMKMVVYDCLKPYKQYINWLLRHEITLYNEYISELYPLSMYEQGTLEEWVKPLPIFDEKNPDIDGDWKRTVLATWDWKFLERDIPHDNENLNEIFQSLESGIVNVSNEHYNIPKDYSGFLEEQIMIQKELKDISTENMI